jgi:hypothetical protein
LLFAAIAGAVLSVPAAEAQEASRAQPARLERAAEKASPWMVLPTFSSDPKLGTSLGLLGAYLHYFDERSQPSMFGAVAQYTSTDSTVGGVFAKTSSGEDHHRVSVFGGGGVIKNDYNDFLGTGKPLKTTDDLRVLAGRYLYRVHGDWFAGAQIVSTNYLIIGDTPLDQQSLNILGLTGFRSTGAGLIAMRDTRDYENMPTKGWVVNANTLAYRAWMSGDEDFDVYRLEAKGFWEHGKGNVLAVRQLNHWTVDAPASAFASVNLRGYKQGQYLGKNMSSLEAEERLRITGSWGATIFAGIACTYGDGKTCDDSENLFPSYGAGIHYIVRPKERIVLNLEYAEGKADNYGVYLKMGYGY